MVTINEMREKGIDLGKVVEITLFKGVEFYDGYTTAPTVNAMGYDPSENMAVEPGVKYVGYVYEIVDDRITLSRGINPDNSVIVNRYGENHFLYFDEKAIHSYRAL